MEARMKERPVLFSAPMIRAILDGRKTQTRRIVKPQPDSRTTEVSLCRDLWMGIGPACNGPGTAQWDPWRKAFATVGDRLWVREAWMPGYFHDPDSDDGPKVSVLYRADNSELTVAAPSVELAEQWDLAYSDDGDEPPPWKPSIHMPRWASRILLEITGVSVERLRDISEGDAEAEGIDFLRHIPNADETLTAKQLYECLWDGLKPPAASAWDANPWVWVISFRRVDA